MKRKKAKDSIEFHGKTVPLAAIGEMDYGDQNEILSKRGNAIQYIEEPTEEQKLIAVKQNGYAIRYIDSPSYELQRISVMQQATAIQFISTPYPDLVDYAFQKDPNVLAFIKDPSYEQMKDAVRRKGGTIQYVENPSMELIEIAIEQNPMSIAYLTNPDHNIILQAIQKKPQSVKNIINRLPRDLIIEALNRNGNLIKYIKNPDEELTSIALATTPSALQFIDNPTVKQQIQAVKTRPSIIREIQDPIEAVRVVAVQEKPDLITDIELSPKVEKEYNSAKLKKSKTAKKEYYKAGMLPSQHIQLQKKYYDLIVREMDAHNSCFFLNQYNESIIDILLPLSKIVEPQSMIIATGFLYKSGLSMLNSILEPIMRKGGDITLTVGSLQHYNPAENEGTALEDFDFNTARYLRGLQNLQYVKLLTYEERFFHGKFYLFQGTEMSAVIIGSSNLSSSGLLINAELNTIFVCKNSDPALKRYEEWYNNFSNECKLLPPLVLSCFNERVEERDIPKGNNDQPVNVPIDDFTTRISELTDEEVQLRLSTWIKHSPSRIFESVKLEPFKGYVLFEFADRNLYVFESVIPNNAFYCFHANDFNHLKALLHEKTKTQLYKERVMYRRGYHMNRRDFEIYVASVF